MPAVKGMPHGCAWGLWDKPGQEKDQLGSLNLLTPEAVQEAFKELRTGERCALKYFPRSSNLPHKNYSSIGIPNTFVPPSPAG